MEINNLLIAIIILSIFAGIGIGVSFARNNGRDSKKLRKLEENLEKEKEHLDLYEKKVLAHFSQTAQLVNKLTDSYREVHAHLANGAEDLCRGESTDVILQLERRNSATSTEDDVKPPLDYAPKASPKQKGVLNESFGIKKQIEQEDQNLDSRNDNS